MVQVIDLTEDASTVLDVGLKTSDQTDSVPYAPKS
jgi:hypothetical protein